MNREQLSLRQSPKFPKFVYFGFGPSGKCRTVGFPTKAGAWQRLLFVFAGEVNGKTHITHPDDDKAARAAGWRVAKARVTP